MNSTSKIIDPLRFNRRQFLGTTAAALIAGGANDPAAMPRLLAADDQNATTRPKVAAIFTEFRFRSHAYNILQSFLAPYLFNGRLTDPGVDVVSFYADQFPEGDMAREVSQRYEIPLFDSIDKALCVGGNDLAVDAVLCIGEHGDYPKNDRGQKMYPRKEFFDASVAVMQRSNRFVPFFNDKHLSYRWDWAKEMYDTAQQYQFPLMAGSSVPLAAREPLIGIPDGLEIEEAVSIHGGPIESYDFHGLEVLQSMIESRRGGETGISSVQLLEGEALQKAVKQGAWSPSLFDAAMQAETQASPSNRPRDRNPKLKHAILLTYRDGVRAAVLGVGSCSIRWNFACRTKGDSRTFATSFYPGPWGNRNLFKALSHAIQYCFINEREPYPVERTLLATGVLDAAMRSLESSGQQIETPHLELEYKPIDFRALRENGTSWKMITVDSEEPSGFEPGDQKWMKP